MKLQELIQQAQNSYKIRIGQLLCSGIHTEKKKREENCLLRLQNVKAVMKVSSTQVLQPNSFFQLLDFVQKYPCQLQNHPSKTFHQVKKQVVKLWVYKVSNWHWRRTAELVMTNSQQPCDEEQGKKWFKLRGSRYEKWGISP